MGKKQWNRVEEAEKRVIFEGFTVEKGNISNLELGLTAFVKSVNEGSNSYKGMFTKVSTVEFVGVKLKEGVELI